MVQAQHWYRAGTFPTTLYQRSIRCGTSPTPLHRIVHIIVAMNFMKTKRIPITKRKDFDKNSWVRDYTKLTLLTYNLKVIIFFIVRDMLAVIVVVPHRGNSVLYLIGNARLKAIRNIVLRSAFCSLTSHLSVNGISFDGIRKKSLKTKNYVYK